MIAAALDQRGILSRWLSEDYRAKKSYDITADSITIHSVKGLDFACVFLMGLDALEPDGRWSATQIDSLAYVGITRARYRLIIPYVKKNDLVERMDDGTELEHPWLLSFLTCAAPYAPSIGQPESGDLLQKRIGRVLAIARAFGYSALVLGAWGCGAFANDPYRTAVDFRAALETEFRGAFSEVVFAITDWSPERRFLGPFGEVRSSCRQ